MTHVCSKQYMNIQNTNPASLHWLRTWQMSEVCRVEEAGNFQIQEVVFLALVWHFAGCQDPGLRGRAGIKAGRAVVTELILPYRRGQVQSPCTVMVSCFAGSKSAVTKKGFHSRKFCVKLFWMAELGRGPLYMWKYLCCFLKCRITAYVLSVVWCKFFPKVSTDWTFTSSRGRLLHGLTRLCQ